MSDIDIEKLRVNKAKWEKEAAKGWTYPIVTAAVGIVVGTALTILIITGLFPSGFWWLAALFFAVAVWNPLAWRFIRPRNIDRNLTRIREEEERYEQELGTLPAVPETDVSQEPREPQESQPQYKKCPYCAEQIRFEAVKCRYCSSQLGA